MYKLPSSTYGAKKQCLRYVLWIDKLIRRYVIHFFSGYSVIRHYGFYPKRIIRHFM